MTSFYKAVSLIVIFIIPIYSAFAGTGKRVPGQAIIRGYFIDTSLSNNPDNTATIRIFVTSYPFGLTAISRTHPLEYNFNCKRYDSFRIVLPVSRTYRYIHFQVRFPGAFHSRFVDGVDNMYIVGPGDNVKCSFYSEYTTFSGKGSAKFNAFNSLYSSILSNIDFERASALSSEGKLDKLFNYVDSIDNISFIKAKNALNKYKSVLSENMYRILQANLFPLRFLESSMYAIHQNAIFGAPEDQIDFTFKCYRALKNREKPYCNERRQVVLSKSSFYLAYLLKKSYADVQMKAYENRDTTTIHSFKPFYDDIKNNYGGLLRDYLLLETFLSFMDFRSDAYSFLNDAIATIKTEEPKRLLMEIRRTSAKGEPFYHFKLKDSLGRVVQLGDYKNKVLVLDFWYTGCENCVILKRALEPIFDKYRGNNEVKFISISIDENISEWKRSLCSGQYTDSSEINLYTNGNGLDDPLIKYYGIKGFPKQFMILNERMYDPNPPRAGDNGRNDIVPSLKGTTAEFDNLIQRAMRELKNKKDQ